MHKKRQNLAGQLGYGSPGSKHLRGSDRADGTERLPVCSFPIPASSPSGLALSDKDRGSCLQLLRCFPAIEPAPE
eukprot:c6832_g1_i1 orf=468-692(+)